MYVIVEKENGLKIVKKIYIIYEWPLVSLIREEKIKMSK